MLGKRGEKPPLPSNCKRGFAGCKEPLLPKTEWEGAIGQE